MSELLFSFFILNSFETSFKIKSLVSFAFNKVRYNLTILYNLKLFSHSITDISFLSFINLNRFFEVWNLRASSINILCSKVTMIVFLYYWLNKYFGLGLIYLTYLHQVATTNCSHYICRINGVGVFLVMLLPSNNVILE